MLSATLGVAALATSGWDATGVLGGVGLPAREAKVSQKFDRKFAQIDYKLQLEALQREDIRDLMDLSVNRMDMYNVVGALLLGVAIDILKDSAVIIRTVEDGLQAPLWFELLIFLHSFSSVGYLLFSLWLAMYGAILSQTMCTRMLVGHVRLSIPTAEQIRRIKVKFYSSGTQVAQRVREHLRPQAQQTSEAAAAGEGPWDREAESVDSDVDGGDAEAAAPRAEEGDREWHMRHWLRERGKWLSYDGFSRATMMVGMNSLLQAIAYTIAANVWRATKMMTFVCLCITKLLSYHTLSIDLGKGALTPKTVAFILACDLLPPMLALLLLTICPTLSKVDVIDAHSAELCRRLEPICALPIFLLHACWMLVIRHELREGARAQESGGDWVSWDAELRSFQLCADGEEGPFRDRVGRGRFLDRRHFNSVSQAVEDLNSGDVPCDDAFCVVFSQSHEAWYVLYRGVRKQEVQRELGLEEDSEWSSDSEGGEHAVVPDAFSDSSDGPQAVSRQYQGVGLRYYPNYAQGKWVNPVELRRPVSDVQAFREFQRGWEFDHKPANVVISFTLAMAFVWLAVGVGHMMVQSMRDRKDGVAAPPPRDPGEVAAAPAARRLLDVEWPSPASLFEVTALHCTGSELLIQSEFALHRAAWLANSSGLGLLEELARQPEQELAAAVCDEQGGCTAALQRGLGNGSSWSLRSLGAELGGAQEEVLLPRGWRLPAAAAWGRSGSSPAGSTMWLAAWDGSCINVVKARRAERGGRWVALPRIKVRPGAGRCSAGAEDCAGWSALKKQSRGTYDGVRALQLGPGGQNLLVLHMGGTMLDAWDLERGVLAERWHLGARYAAMCHNGAELHLARAGGGRPLEVSPLPRTLQDPSGGSSLPTVARTGIPAPHGST